MDQASLEAILAGSPIKQFRYFDRLGSTNDEAGRWAAQGAPDMALVVADEQTAGKGRLGRKWVTPSGAALAFSLVLRPQAGLAGFLPRWSALGALAVCDALDDLYTLRAAIKWPNDVLLEGRKTAGILAEMAWSGEQAGSLILGVGINVAPAAISAAALPKSALIFPAACIEEFLDRPVDRLQLLRRVLEWVIDWRPRLASRELISAWEDRLAFRGEQVQFLPGEAGLETDLSFDNPENLPTVLEGKIIGLAPDGALRLRTLAGDEILVRVGDIRLRPV
jgi:BirA family biotin operon repressor/biotin-[acetyl-CoA-carboxylase] ligase